MVTRLRLAFVLLVPLAGCGSTSSGGAAVGSGGSSAYRAVGSPCVTESELVCALDGSAPTSDVIACKSGAWALAFSCPGAATCATEIGHTSVSCGTASFAPAGTPCSTPSAAACSPDLGAVTVCTGGTWHATNHCAPTTCRFATGTDGVARAQCGDDNSFALGDACTFAAGHGVCSNDHTAVLDCESGTTKVLTPCAAPAVCVLATVDGGVGVGCH